jgi:alpha-1,4-digalacturonate transport system permease protein
MDAIRNFLIRKRGGARLDWSDMITYLYLVAAVFVMFGPVLWVVMSSFKTETQLLEFPPRFLPYAQETVTVAGYDQPLPLFTTTLDGQQRTLAQIRRVGLEAQLIDPEHPPQDPQHPQEGEVLKLKKDQLKPVESVKLAWENYRDPMADAVGQFRFSTYLKNSVIVTIVATAITLLINSMAAFALSKYRFRGRELVLVIIVSTLMIPISVILVPVFLVITRLKMINSLWGVIIPGAATPTGVFLLRQYMLTIPDELLESARIDGATEWRIYWQVILPLARPALAVLAIFSVMWRWNDFLWPLIVLTRNEKFTLQVGLRAFQGELQVQWHYVLAMTVLSLLPITIVFAFLQRFITSGIATTGMKG